MAFIFKVHCYILFIVIIVFSLVGLSTSSPSTRHFASKPWEPMVVAILISAGGGKELEVTFWAMDSAASGISSGPPSAMQLS